MSTAIHEPQTTTCVGRSELTEDDVRTQVWGLLGALYPRGDLVERRGEHRYPYPYLLHLTPVADDGSVVQSEAVSVVGKYLSEKGIGFYHPQPLPHRKMIATLEGAGGAPLAFMIDVTWCRFTKQGWYESGGRFLDVVPSTMPLVE